MTTPADERTAKAREQRKMHPEAITDRIRLAYAAQKELCAEINRSEDGEFALGLFDVLQEMYNAGYEKACSSAIKEAREECARIAETLPAAKDDEELWTPIGERIAAAIRALGER